MVATVERGTRLVVLDPTAEPVITAATMAARLPDLAGKTIGLLDNSKPNSAHLLDCVAEVLARDYAFAGVVRASKPSATSVAAPKALDALAQQCSLVVTAIGD
jgi:hypothetical protein